MTPREVIQFLRLNIPSSGFERAWSFVYVNIKLQRKYCQLDFLRNCNREKLIPNFIRNTINIPFQCTNRLVKKLDKLQQDLLNDTIRVKQRDIQKLREQEQRSKAALWALPKSAYLTVKNVMYRVVSAERAVAIPRLSKKLERLRQNNDTISNSTFNNIYTTVLDDTPCDQSSDVADVTLIDVELTEPERRILGKGPSFVPSPGKSSPAELAQVATGIERAMFGLRWRIARTDNHEHNKVKTKITTSDTDAMRQDDGEDNDEGDNDECIGKIWSEDPKIIRLCKIKGKMPPKADTDSENAFSRLKQDILREYSHYSASSHINNITVDERRVLHDLKKRDIIIKKSDKSKSLVVMKPETYVDKAMVHLTDESSYEETSTTAQELEKDVTTLLLKWKGQFNPNIMKHIVPKLTKLPEFYGLPKTHKSGNPLRPVVAACDSPCTGLSIIIERILNQLLEFVPSNLKNTDQVIRDLRDEFPDRNCADAIVVTMDVRALYPSIPIQESVECVNSLLTDHYDDIDTMGLSVECITDCLTFILNNNIFRFGNKTYRQTSGVAMGNQVAPPLAIIFMHFLESKVLHAAKWKPSLFRRYVDDILFIWRHGIAHLREFIADFQQAHPSIKFTYEDSDTSQTQSICYMDVEISVANSRLSYQLYEKPSDSGTCIPFNSSTPRSVKHAFVKSYFDRARRLSSDNDMREKSYMKVIRKLQRNGYPREFIESGYSIKKIKAHNTDYYKRIAIRLPYKSDALDKSIRKKLAKSKLPLRIVYNTKPRTLQGRLTRSALKPQECPEIPSVQNNLWHMRRTVYWRI